MDKDRILEYISKTLAARFGNLEDPELSEMMALPSLFTYESGVNSDAQIGRINKFRKGGKEVRIEFELDPALPPFLPPVDRADLFNARRPDP